MRVTRLDYRGNVIKERQVPDQPYKPNYVELPDWMKDKDGNLARFLPKLDVSKGQLYFITCTGIGDCSWVVSKLWSVAEKAKAEGREVWFLTPSAGPYERVNPYFQLMGLNHRVLEGEDTRHILSFPGEFDEGEYDNGGVFYVHANRHIEEGKPLHEHAPVQAYPGVKSGTWHPWLPFKNPAPPLTLVHPGERPPQSSVNEGVWKMADPAARKTYVVVHMASPTYCEGNHFPRTWATIIEWIEKHVAPVKLIGAKWDEGMIEKVTSFYTPSLPACIGQSLATALTVIANSTAMLGVDSGLSIMATYYGLPALRCYPRWLALMPGTFEDTDTLHPNNRAIFMDELLDTYREWFQGL